MLHFLRLNVLLFSLSIVSSHVFISDNEQQQNLDVLHNSIHSLIHSTRVLRNKITKRNQIPNVTRIHAECVTDLPQFVRESCIQISFQEIYDNISTYYAFMRSISAQERLWERTGVTSRSFSRYIRRNILPYYTVTLAYTRIIADNHGVGENSALERAEQTVITEYCVPYQLLFILNNLQIHEQNVVRCSNV